MATQRKRIVVNSGSSLVNGAVIYDKPCFVHSIHAIHSTGAASAIAIFDATEIPANGTLPQQIHRVVANADADIEPSVGVFFENGLVVAESSTFPLFTIDPTPHLFIHAIITDRDYRP